MHQQLVHIFRLKAQEEHTVTDYAQPGNSSVTSGR